MGKRRDQLERFLAEHPPVTSTMLADRLLLQVIAPSPDRDGRERRAFLATLPRALAFAQTPEVVGDLTSMCVALWAYEALGAPEAEVAELRFALALPVRATPVEGLPEPFRSTAAYWRHRAALARPPPPPSFADAPTPPGPLRHAFATHLVFFATGYGQQRLRVTGLADDTRQALDEALNTTDVDDGDSVALSLLACAGLVGVNERWVPRLCNALEDCAHRDGGLKTRNPDIVARHHAAVVALLALRLLGN